MARRHRVRRWRPSAWRSRRRRARRRRATGSWSDVRVLHEWHGEPNGYLGWAVERAADIDRDGSTDVILERAGHRGRRQGVGVLGPDRPPAAPLRRRARRLLRRRDRRRGRHRPRRRARHRRRRAEQPHDVFGRGRAYLYSGRTGRLLHVWEAAGPDDTLGSAVAGAGDQDRDGYDDVLVGAIGDDLAGVDAGAAFVFSGRTHRVLRRIDGGDPGGGFGSATDCDGEPRGDRRPELIVGAWTRARRRAAAAASRPRARRRAVLARAAGRRRAVRQLLRGGRRAASTATGSRTSTRPTTPRAAATAAPASTPAATARSSTAWPGGPATARGPGREAGDVDRDGRVDLAVGSYTAGAAQAGRVDVRSGATGRILRTFTSTTAGEQLGFDAVGVGDTNRDGRIDLLLSAAEGDAVYLVAGERRR